MAVLTSTAAPGQAREWVECAADDPSWASVKRGAGRFSPRAAPPKQADEAGGDYCTWLSRSIDGLAARSQVEVDLHTCECVVRSQKLQILEDDFVARDVYEDFAGPKLLGPPGRPLRLLALHGTGSNNDITSIQLVSLEWHEKP